MLVSYSLNVLLQHVHGSSIATGQKANRGGIKFIPYDRPIYERSEWKNPADVLLSSLLTSSWVPFWEMLLQQISTRKSLACRFLFIDAEDHCIIGMRYPVCFMYAFLNTHSGRFCECDAEFIRYDITNIATSLLLCRRSSCGLNCGNHVYLNWTSG